MQTSHTLHIGDARDLSAVPSGSVHLVVTSPPYPMIAMWDEVFAELAPGSVAALEAGQGRAAFEAMHAVLDAVWEECARVLAPGGFACVNIGDATRSLAEEFALYPNQARISTALSRVGLTPLPDILWRKPSNAPNKFMGSGMLPAGAYVTYEHEYVLIFRKGGKREFTGAERTRRSESAYFWEERNLWFSDLWTDLRGTRQGLGAGAPRERSAAFPFELPWRLVHMFSVQGDVVLDPFVGTGTTMAAAFAAGRQSVGVERALELAPRVGAALEAAVGEGRRRAEERLVAHFAAMAEREGRGKTPLHRSTVYGFGVVTGQEQAVRVLAPVALHSSGEGAWVGEHDTATLPPFLPGLGGARPHRAAGGEG
jgi:DNA modification methylase